MRDQFPKQGPADTLPETNKRYQCDTTGIAFHDMRLVVLTAVTSKSIVLWDVTLCSLVGRYHRLDKHTAPNFSTEERRKFWCQFQDVTAPRTETIP
jgi:hypothetical protein